MAKTKEQHDDYFSQLAEVTGEKPSAWMDEDFSGQLAVDVYETPTDIILRAAIAGVRSEDIDISVNNDMVTIKGVRRIEEEERGGAYLYQECYWGGFSRTVILPMEVHADKVKATLRNGILRVMLPKVESKPVAPITVIDEDEA